MKPLHHSWERLQKSRMSVHCGRTLSIDANHVAPHSVQFEERLCCSLRAVTPLHLNSTFNLLLLCLRL